MKRFQFGAVWTLDQKCRPPRHANMQSLVCIIPVTCSDGLKTPRARTWLLLALCALGTISWAQTPQTPPRDIAPQALQSALAAFADHTGLQVIYVSTIVEGKNSKGAGGEGSPAEVLTQLLEGTGLRFSFLNERTVQILPPAPPPERSSHRRSQSPHSPTPAGEPVTALEEVVVSASRRDEKQSDVAMSIATWTWDMLNESGVKSLGDLATLTPGVEFDFYPDLGPGTLTNIAIRGVNSRDGSSTGLFLDDTPMRSDAGGTFGKTFPFPFDLERVEVLRGPQGTLLGEGAEGGAIRMIQTPPSLSKTSGFAQGQVATTANGGATYELGAAGGGPLKENVIGFRASAWTRRQGGYIDRVNPFNNVVVDHDANSSVDESFRGALTAAVGGGFEITPAVTYQSHSAQDSSTFSPALSDPGAGVLRSDKLLAQPVHDEFSVATLTISGALHSAQLSAVTSHYHRHVSAVTDATNNPVDWGNPLGPEYPTSVADALSSNWGLSQSTLSQEIRLTSVSLESRSSWIVGGLYQHTQYTDLQRVFPHTNSSGVQVGDYRIDYYGANTSIAAYGEVRIRLGERLAANFGMRAEHATYDATIVTAPLGDPNPTTTLAAGRESPLSPKLVMEYRPSARALLYAGVTSGYRSGGVNSPIHPWCPDVIPVAFKPDQVWNFEVGAKNTLFDGRMQLDTSVFHMRWLNMQNTMPLGCGSEYVTNVGGAVSNGFDLGLQAVAGSHTRINLAVGYADAHYADTVVANGAIRVRRGDAVGSLPLVPSPLDASASIAYDYPMSRGYMLTARAEDAYHSHNPGPFYSQDPASWSYDPAKRSNPATNVLNLRVTAQRADLDLSIFIENALNAQPILLSRNAYTGSTYFYATTLRPRTVSLNIDRRF